MEVSYPTAIGIVPGLPVEAEVGSYIPVAVGLRDPSGESDFLLFVCFSALKFIHGVQVKVENDDHLSLRKVAVIWQSRTDKSRYCRLGIC